MRSLFRLARPLAAPVLAFTSACAAGPADVDVGAGSETQAIINGEACDATVAPSAVAILLDHDISFFGQMQTIKTVGCTGTLIAPDVVLTAGHCVDSSTVTLGLGEVTRESYAVTREPDLGALAEGQSMEFPAEAVTVRAWVKHPEYSLTSGNMMAPDGLGAFHDIALMFLSAPLQGVTPAVVITADERAQLAADAAVTIAGWGQQTATSGPLQQPPPGTVGRKVCGASVLTELGENEFRVGLGAETTRKCHGDSGGPTYINVNTESPVTERVIGVTSRAYSAAEDCNAGGVDTRVDAYLDWLDTEMRDACTEGTRTACDEPGLLPPPPAPGSSSSSSSSGSTGGSSSSSSGDAQGSGGDSGGPADGCTQSGAGPWAGLGLLAVVLARVRRAVRARA